MSGTKVHSNYSDLLTFTRASKGHALRPVSYGDELVTNGTFDTDSDWTKSSGATISGGKLNIAVTASGYEYAYQLKEFKVGAIYVLTATVNGTSGFNMRFRAGGDDSGLDAVDGQVAMTGSDQQVQKIFQATGTADRINIERHSGGDYSFTVDNVSLKEVTFDQPDGTLTLFEHPDNVPRVEYDADGNRLGLLVEESRTNLLTQSTMKDVNYTKTRAEITDNQITSPDGTQNASKVNETTGTSGQHFIYRQDVSYTSGNNYTFSVFAKADTTTVVQLLGTSSVFGSAVYANFDIENGTIGSQGALVVDSSIQDVGNGWYRLSVTGTATITAASTSSLIVAFTNNNIASARAPSYVGDTAQQFYVFGGQVEAGSFPTSYMKTTGSTTTRSADVASIPVADFGYNQSEGTLITTVETFDTDYGSYAWVLDGANDTFAYTHASGAWRVAGAGGTVAYVGSLPSSDFFKLGYAFDGAGSAALVDGGSVTTPSHSQPTQVQTLRIGNTASSSAQLNGHIKKLMYIPRRVTNAQLISLTE